MEMYCTNPACRWHSKRKGGKFLFRDGLAYCEECLKEFRITETGKNPWQFETLNINGDPNKGPVKVNSLHHLRQLVKQHGVVSVAANFDSRNWDAPPRGR